MRVRRTIWALAGALAVLLPLPVPARNWSGLLKKNPFGDQPEGEKPPEPAPQLELRGVVKEKGGYLLSLYDAISRKSWWMEVGQSENDLLARGYDPKQEMAMLERQGKPMALSLKSTGLRGVIAVAHASQSNGIALGNAAVATPQAAMSPLPSSEVQRLAQIGEEIRQRREQRRREPG